MAPLHARADARPADRQVRPRRRSLTACGCALLGAVLATAPLPAQEPGPGPGPFVLGLLTDPAGMPVPDALVTFVADPEPDVQALRDLSPMPAPQTTHSDTRGVFRLPSSRPGTLVAKTARGLGALAERCWPGRAVRLRLQPMAEVTLPGPPGGVFTLWPAFGDRRRLPAQRGAAVRLPAGRYECWIRCERGYAWQRLELRPGERAQLSVPDGHELRIDPGDELLHPAGFPEVRMEPDEDGVLRLLGTAAHATLYRVDATGAVRLHAHGPDLGAGDAPPLELRLVPTEPATDDGAAAATAWLLERRPAGGFRVVTRVAAGAGGRVLLPVPSATGEGWVAVTAAGFAPIAAPEHELRRRPQVELRRGHVLACRLRTADGDPATAAVVTFEPPGGGPVLATAYADDVGAVRLGPVTGPGVLRVLDPHHRAVELHVADGETNPVDVRLDRGASVRGVVRLPDGDPAAGVAVSVRAPGGTFPLGGRTAVTGADGGFEVSGLDADRPMVVFATQQRDGRTWSSRRQVIAGGAPVELELRCEDPVLDPPGGR